MKRTITEFMEQEKWMDVREPDGLQDRIMAFSIFSAGDVRTAANEGRASNCTR